MQTRVSYEPAMTDEKPFVLSAEEVLMLLDMCVAPLSTQPADTREKEELVMRLVRFYREFHHTGAKSLAFA